MRSHMHDCCLDGSRPGLVKRLIKPWVKGLAKAPQKSEGDDAEEDPDEDADAGEAEVRKKGYCERKIDVHISEASAKAKKGKVRGTALLCQTFGAHLVSKTPICLPERTCEVLQRPDKSRHCAGASDFRQPRV